MAAERLPISGFPHLALSAQDNDGIRQRTLAHLTKAGFTVNRGHLIPPDVSTGPQVIAAVTAAYHSAKHS